MNSTSREITLASAQVSAAIEEYLHRLNLIDADDTVSIIGAQADQMLLNVKKEVTVH